MYELVRYVIDSRASVKVVVGLAESPAWPQHGKKMTERNTFAVPAGSSVVDEGRIPRLLRSITDDAPRHLPPSSRHHWTEDRISRGEQLDLCGHRGYAGCSGRAMRGFGARHTANSHD